MEDGVVIEADAEAIPLATTESKLATTLMEVLSKEECLWQATDDELCVMVFTDDGFAEYDGDLAKSATVEFYSV